MAKRKVKRPKRNALYYPTAALSGGALRRAAAAQTAAEYAPKQRALAQQLTQATTQGTAVASRAGDYYRQLAEREAKQVAAQQALSQMLKSDTAKIGVDTQARFDAQAKDVGAHSQESGMGIQGADQTDKVNAELASLRGLASTRQQATEASAASQGSNWEALSNALSQARGLRGGEIQGQLLTALANEQQKIRDQETGLKADRSAAGTANLLKLRQQGFENLATLKTLGIKEADINATLAGITQRARDNAANRRAGLTKAQIQANTSLTNTQARIQSQERIQRLNRKLRRELAGGTDGAGAKLTAGQIASNQKFFGSVMSVASDYTRLSARPGWTGHRIASHFRKSGVPAIALNAAADIANYGYILPGHVAALTAAGYSIPPSLRKGSGAPANKK